MSEVYHMKVTVDGKEYPYIATFKDLVDSRGDRASLKNAYDIWDLMRKDQETPTKFRRFIESLPLIIENGEAVRK